MDMEVVKSIITDAMKLKRQMLKRKIVAAKVKCPRCEGMLHGRLAGRKNHMRFWCDGPCDRRMME